MRRVLWILAAATAAVAIAWWVAFLPGTVSARVAGYAIEAATPLAAVAAFLVVVAIHLALRLLGSVLGVPSVFMGWRRGSRRRSGDAAVSRALVALAAGEAATAQREAQRARGNLGDTPQTMQLAAEAARLAGKTSEAEAIFQAMAGRPDGAFLGLRGLFRLAVEREDWTEASALARKAEALQPGGNWLREARLRLAEETGDWSRALVLAGPDLPEEVVATAAALASADPEAAARLARQAWKANESFTPAVLAHAAALRRNGRDRAAEEVVREAWKVAPHPDLAAFLMAESKDPRGRLRIAATLSNANADHVETQYLLARLSLEAGDMREARYHAERAMGLDRPTRRLFMLLADLATAEGIDPTPALREAATADADPTWRCGQCGTAHSEWHPVCPSCHTPARIAWGRVTAPRRLLTAS